MTRKSAEEFWRDLLTRPHSSGLAWLPHSPRCSICGVPFAGLGGSVARAVGYRQWNKNPTLCNRCYRSLPEGGIETDIAVMFADLRGSTALAERLEPAAFADILSRFYGLKLEVLAPHRAIIDKMIGDEVMAFFAPMGRQDYQASAVAAAVDLMRRFREVLPEEEHPRLGIGLHKGRAFVGKVGAGEIKDLTALDDTVNSAARLQSEARAGEIVISEDLYHAVALDFPDLEQRILRLRGRQEPIVVRVLRVAGEAPEASGR